MLQQYFAHRLILTDVHQLLEGTRGRIALLFDYERAKKGGIHWSVTPLEVEKQEDGVFRVTTPGRFQDLVIQKIQGKESGEDYLAVGDTSFIAILFNGHDRQPPDKIFRFVRDSEEAPWRLQVLDYASK